MNGDPRQVRLVAGMVVAGLILIGIGLVFTTGGGGNRVVPPEREVVTTTIPAVPASSVPGRALPAPSLAAPTHMPPGQIAEHYTASPRVEAQAGPSGTVAVAERTGTGPVMLWTCYASPVVGRWLVTSLTPGIGGGSGG